MPEAVGTPEPTLSDRIVKTILAADDTVDAERVKANGVHGELTQDSAPHLRHTVGGVRLVNGWAVRFRGYTAATKLTQLKRTRGLVYVVTKLRSQGDPENTEVYDAMKTETILVGDALAANVHLADWSLDEGSGRDATDLPGVDVESVEFPACDELRPTRVGNVVKAEGYVKLREVYNC